MGNKLYLVTDSVSNLDWNTTGEQKVILGFDANKATAKIIGTRVITIMENGELKKEKVADTSTVAAWFTTSIPIPAGPKFQGNYRG